MPTFIFHHVYGSATVKSTAASLNAARDKLAGARPDQEYHDGSIWEPWECWIGGKCVWHTHAETGECTAGPRSLQHE